MIISPSRDLLKAGLGKGYYNKLHYGNSTTTGRRYRHYERRIIIPKHLFNRRVVAAQLHALHR